jgi:hypothetical protein
MQGLVEGLRSVVERRCTRLREEGFRKLVSISLTIGINEMNM